MSLVASNVVTISDVAEALASCLCAELGSDPCFCGVLPGQGVAIDLAGCGGGDCDAGGMAYVRLTSTYPSTEVGVADLTPGNCDKGRGFDLELGVYRCFPINADGTPLDAAAQLAVSRQQIDDEAAMRRAIICCDWLDNHDLVTGQYAPYGPAGGVVGGVIPLSAWLP